MGQGWVDARGVEYHRSPEEMGQEPKWDQNPHVEPHKAQCIPLCPSDPSRSLSSVPCRFKWAKVKSSWASGGRPEGANQPYVVTLFYKSQLQDREHDRWRDSQTAAEHN